MLRFASWDMSLSRSWNSHPQCSVDSTLQTALCVAQWSGSVPVHAESQGVNRCSWWMCLPRAHSHVSCVLLWLPGTTGGGRTFNSIMLLLLWPRDERGWCWVTAGNNFLCWDIVFGERALDWPRGWNSNRLFFLEERPCFKCTKGSGVSVSEAVVCQQYKRYCSCCSPWNKSTRMGITGCDKKKRRR